MSRQTKKTKIPNLSVQKRTTIPLIANHSQKPIWVFTMLDNDGKFAFNLNRSDFEYQSVFQKVIDYSNLRWDEIEKQTHDRGKSKHHFLTNDKNFSKEARERIHIKNVDDQTDAIFSFAFTNKLRIIGLRTNNCFYPIWYDANHEFYPVSR